MSASGEISCGRSSTSSDPSVSRTSIRSIGVAQLADVPRPVVGHQGLPGAAGDRRSFPAVQLGELFEEVIGQHGNVDPPFPQRRQKHGQRR